METIEKQPDDKMKGLIDKAKELADKAEEFFDVAAEKVRNSETLKKAGNYIEEKIDELEKSDVKEKLKSFADKVEVKAEEILEKTKIHGKKFADKAENMADDLSDRLKGKKKQ